MKKKTVTIASTDGLPPVVTLYMVSFPEEPPPWQPGIVTTVTAYQPPAPLTEADIRRIIREELARFDRKQRRRTGEL